MLAGTNGAGKSSIAGAMFIEESVEYFNLNEAAGANVRCKSWYYSGGITESNRGRGQPPAFAFLGWIPRAVNRSQSTAISLTAKEVDRRLQLRRLKC